jgi:Aminoglycoside-2''-adenylyltransferase
VTPITSDYGRWEPLSLAQVLELLGEGAFPWWVAGGWAIDLFVGRETRHHEDLDVVVLRRDQFVIQASMGDWELWAADPPGTLRPWAAGEFLAPAIHDIWCRRASSEPWSLQLMLAESQGDRWAFRRNPRITTPLTRIGRRTADGTPYLAPDVQLLFKSGPNRRPKDEADFTVALPRLDLESRQWLAIALDAHSPGHPWLTPLAEVALG